MGEMLRRGNALTAKRHHFISPCYLRGFARDPASPQLAADPDLWKAKMQMAKEEGTMSPDADTDKIRELILNCTAPGFVDITAA